MLFHLLLHLFVIPTHTFLVLLRIGRLLFYFLHCLLFQIVRFLPLPCLMLRLPILIIRLLLLLRQLGWLQRWRLEIWCLMFDCLTLFYLYVFVLSAGRRGRRPLQRLIWICLMFQKHFCSLFFSFFCF